MTEDQYKKTIKTLEFAAEFQRQDAYISKQKLLAQQKYIRDFQEKISTYLKDALKTTTTTTG